MSTTTSRVGRCASLAVCIGALGITWLQSHRIGAQLSTVRDQVENSHSTNLRDDIDEVRAMVSAVRDQVNNNHTTNLRDDIDEVRAMVFTVRDQVQNSHSSNLRDEIDEVRAIVSAVRDDIRDRPHSIGGLGGELRDERDVRVTLEQHVAELRSGEDVPSFVELR